MSFVVVLPTEPVTPTTHQSWSDLHHWARRSTNSSASSPVQRTRAAPVSRAAASASSSGSRVSATAAAPPRTAAAAKSFPSARSPGNATNRPPLCTLRESMATPPTRASAVPATSEQPVASQICSTEQEIIERLPSSTRRP